MFRTPVKVANRGVVLIIDGAGNTVCSVCQTNKNRQEALRDAQTIADAINNYLTNHTRRSDPQTSRLAELAMKDVLKNRYRRLALEYFVTFGWMTDEQLYDKFAEAEVPISEARLRHIRLELQRHHLVIKIMGMTRKNKNKRDCSVYTASISSKGSLKVGIINGKANS